MPRVRLSDLSAMNPREFQAQVATLARAQREAREKGAPCPAEEGLRARIRRYELRYEITSAQLLRELRSGERKETAEIADWLFCLSALPNGAEG